MTLLQRLQQANYQTTAITGLANCSFEQLLVRAWQIRQQYPASRNKAIAVRFTDLSEFCAQIVAFDGWCAQIYLLPDTSLLPCEITLFPEGMPNRALHSKHFDSHPVTITTRWFMATSGTTGTPKWISHTLNSLTRAVKVATHNTALRWALCYQPTRFAGLQVVLQSLLSGAAIVDCSEGDITKRLINMQKGAVNAISATPSLWRQLLMTGNLTCLALKQITLGGEIADQLLLDTLAKQFPQARLLHIYASTEAGAGFAVADKKAGFPADWLRQGHGGLEFKIDKLHHLWLKLPQQPDSALAERLDEEGFLDTEDLVNVTAERVYFLGRASGTINVGGNKVQPEQIEQVLLLHPAILQARVYGKHSSVLGQLVAADVVVDDSFDHKTLKLKLIQHCMESLSRHQIPTQLNFIDYIATNASGKLSRKQHKDDKQND